MDEANQHQAHGVVDVTIVKPSAQRQRRCNSPKEKTALSPAQAERPRATQRQAVKTIGCPLWVISRHCDKSG
jgi:hypothetical protein